MEKAIWLIAGGPMQHVAAKKIKELGYHLILSDGSPNAFCKSLADTYVQVDTFSVEGHLEAASKIKTKVDIKAVMTTAADCHGTVSKLAQSLGLHHLDPKISEICRDKSLTRKLLKEVGIYQPESHLVQTFAQAQAILQKAKVPYVMKATDNSGSRGFMAIDPKTGITEEQFNYTKSMGTTGSVIVEEKLIADENQISEASAETVWYEGKMYWLNWVDRIFPRDLKFFPQIKLPEAPAEGIEVGHINPAHHDISVKQQAMRDIEKAGKALGMDKQKGGHILKADLFFSYKGPVILEMTPRTSGGWDSSGSSIARGADIPGGVIHMALGGKVDLDSWHRYFEYKDVERNVVVMSTIPDQAKDCVGRLFYLASSYDSVEKTLAQALVKVQKGENIVPVS